MGEGNSGHELEHEVDEIALALQVMDEADVGMTHLREHVRLALEPRTPLPIAAELLREYLDRDVALQPGVMGAVHLAHTTCAYARDHLAPSQPGPGFQRHWR